jgi:hypothetical protein
MKIKVNIDKMMPILNPAIPFLQKSDNIILGLSQDKLYLIDKSMYWDFLFIFDCIATEDNDSIFITVNTIDFLRIIKTMNRNVELSIGRSSSENSELTIKSENSKYEIVANILNPDEEVDIDEYLNYYKISNKIGKLDNSKFTPLTKHININADDDSSQLCCLDGYWYATNRYNAARFKSGFVDKIVIDGIYSKFISLIREDLKVYIPNQIDSKNVLLVNSNFIILITNNLDKNNLFKESSNLFNDTFLYLATLDSKEFLSSINNLLMVMKPENIEDDLTIYINQSIDSNIPATCLYVKTNDKYGYECIELCNLSNISFNSIIIDPIGLSTLLSCCDNNIVDIFYKKNNSGEQKSSILLKIEYNGLEQIIGAKCK